MNIEKLIWTDEDFKDMGWHDCKIYAIAFNDQKFEFSFDIDYIFKFINPEKDNTDYKFLVSPATLIFRNVYDIKMSAYGVDIQIQDITRENPTTPKNINHLNNTTIEYDWIIETNNGEITFKSIGYNQIVRKQPKLLDRQQIGMVERGGNYIRCDY